MIARPYNRDELKARFRRAEPFPHVAIDDFLEPELAQEVARAYPTFEAAQDMGLAFDAINERKKVQITDASAFPEPIKRLNDFLASPEFLGDLEFITGIPKLLADPQLAGGGMHLTGPGGRLDVHVDFNFDEAREWHRRLNVLLFLNPTWEPTWGGGLELWDKEVKRRYHEFMPAMNRLVMFETSEISFHGVQPVTCPDHQIRKSFATYYYTEEAPAEWDGQKHTTVFRARPDERLRGMVLMPAERIQRELKRTVQRGVSFASRRLRRFLK